MKWIKQFLKKLTYQERCPQKLALSFCIGNYIAFSPFPGLHTAMVFVCSYLFQLNYAVTWAVSVFVNNPWTLVPVFLADYIFGYWLVHTIFRLSVPSLNVWGIQYINGFFEHTLKLPAPCIWSFLIGGNLLGVITSVMLYPIMKHLFSKMIMSQKIQNPL